MPTEPILREEYFPTDKFNDNFTYLDTGKADKATTLVGYGIEDAYTSAEVDGKFALVDEQLQELDTGKADANAVYTTGAVDALLTTKSPLAHTHSASDIASGTMSPARIAQDAGNRFVTDAEKATWDAGGTGAVTYATNAEAAAGTATGKAMSPATVLHAIQTLAIGTLGTLTDTAITAADSVKSALQKLQGQVMAAKSTASSAAAAASAAQSTANAANTAAGNAATAAGNAQATANEALEKANAAGAGPSTFELIQRGLI